jgi:predicted site-specific integrase-resolvase
VSTRNQKDDLQRQVEYVGSLYPEGTEIITDIGSGLNFKREGLKTILERAIAGDIKELVVAHKDRLCRFGFELLEFIISKYSNGTIMVLDDKTSSTETEFANDILQILTVFSARLNGRRKYKKKRKHRRNPRKQSSTKR